MRSTHAPKTHCVHLLISDTLSSGTDPGKRSYHERSQAGEQNVSPSKVDRISIREGNDTDVDDSDQENNNDMLDGSDYVISLPDQRTLDKNIVQLLESPVKRKKDQDEAGDKDSVRCPSEISQEFSESPETGKNVTEQLSMVVNSIGITNLKDEKLKTELNINILGLKIVINSLCQDIIVKSGVKIDSQFKNK